MIRNSKSIESPSPPERGAGNDARLPEPTFIPVGKTIEFIVQAPLLVYGCGRNDLEEFKKRVYQLALEGGFPAGRFKTSCTVPAKLSVVIYWSGKIAWEWENVYAVISCSLFSDARYLCPGAVNGVAWMTGGPTYASVKVELPK